MKRFIYLTIVLLMAGMSVSTVQANDYLEKKYHYSVYATGQDKIHFKIPVWAYGAINDYLALPTSHFSYKVDNQSETEVLAWGAHARKDNNQENGRGTVTVKLQQNQGDIIITSINSGVNYQVEGTNKWTKWLTVNQNSDAECDRLTLLEFDWYPPSSLEGKTFSIRIYSRIVSKFLVVQTFMNEDDIQDYFRFQPAYDNNWWMDGTFTSTNNSLTPQLYDPYLYQLNENGIAGYGYAAIPYAVFDEPVGYRTSYDATTIKLSDENRAGTMYLMTNDTLQTDYYADFDIWRSKEAGTTRTLRSTSVNVAPYHRIYNFEAYEELDSTGTFTGNNILSWNIKNPMLADIVQGDYFVIERSTDSTFTDAEQLKLVPLKRDSLGIYSFQDESRKTWSGNMNNSDTLKGDVSRRVNDYLITDAEGKPAYLMDFRLSTNKMNLPSIPVYYRIARASATLWGWDTQFVSKTTMLKNNYLAPLADIQPDYTLDAENHLVNFRILLDNKEILSPELVPESDFNLSYMITDNLRENLTIHSTLTKPSTKTLAYITIDDADGNRLITKEALDNPRDFNVPRGSRVTVDYLYSAVWKYYHFEVGTDVDLHFNVDMCKSGYCILGVSTTPHDHSAEYVTDALLQHLKDSIYHIFQEEYSMQVYGRCMWDKTANLVLIRKIEETGQAVEMIIPQDSIRRQPDGSWVASYTDAADQACMHYSYAVRIDQSRSDLRMQDPVAQLQPKTLHGPELYFDEGAEIRSFIASRGAASTEMKSGVLLHWVPTNQSVDRYILQRKEVNSDNIDTTLYAGIETSFFDDTALPSVHYEYTVTAKFNCNGKRTDNSATAIGWRTPYGEISGSVLLTDNSGMNGVDVALESNGTVIRTMRTDATGAYRFDSLTYDLNGSTDYAVIPTHKYAQFSFNNTSASTAAVTLSADNAVASAIDFVNLSCTRLTGRVLYKNSTVPVAGAMFLLNGDTIRRGGAPLQSAIDGTFEIIVAENQPNRLQVCKAGHIFEGDGILHVEEGEDMFALTKPLDGARFYDVTKVRLVGRVAGGNNQRDLPEAYGEGTNNLGDNLQLVLQLEGDNTAHFVHDPNDLTRDTVQARFTHTVYSTNKQSAEPERTVGETNMLMEKKRITIAPDPLTGEYQVDLFPVKYKVVQATANGYATLFAASQGNEVIDLTNAPLYEYIAKYNDMMERVVVTKHNLIDDEKEVKSIKMPYSENMRNGDSVHYQAVYDRIYHNPVKIELVQNIYGIDRKGFGEPEMEVGGMHPGDEQTVALYTPDGKNGVNYTLGYPIFYGGRKYQFKSKAYEDFYYNNDESGTLDRVPQRGGNVIVRNGLHSSQATATYALDDKGENSAIWLEVDNIDVENIGTVPTRNVSVAFETEGNVAETNVFSAFVTGMVVEGNSLRSAEGSIQLLDIIRDPGGAGSSAYVDNGSTYSLNFTQSVKAEFGVEFQPTWGSDITQYVGIYSGAAAGGTWTGNAVQTQKAFSFSLPLSYQIDYGSSYSYSLTTNERISTSSSSTLPSAVGTPADVFLGTTLANIVGKAKTISIIDDSLYRACKPSFDSGTMLLLAQGKGPNGKTYYLTTGQKIVVGAAVNNTFAYSQRYVLGTLIPRLAMERQSLMMHFKDSAQAQAMADELGRPVYWYIEENAYLNDTIPLNSHRMFTPNNGQIYMDEVDMLNNRIAGWLKIIYTNEMEKVKARANGMKLGTYSASAGVGYSYSETHNCSYSYNELPVAMAGQRLWQAGAAKAAGTLFGRLAARGFMKFIGISEVTSAASALNEYFKDAPILAEGPDQVIVGGVGKEQKTVDEVMAQAPGVKFSIKMVPISNMSADKRMTTTASISKSAGFSIVPDPAGDISIGVYKAEFDTTWTADTEEVLDYLNEIDNDGFKYGSFVFFTEGGSTMCPHEDAETTDFYNPGTPLHNGTEWVAKPELTADVYEMTNIAPDKRASFRVQLYNQGQVDAGVAEGGLGFWFCLDGASNPDGAKVYLNGLPLMQSIYYWIAPGSPITQTIEVERGTVDDYNLVFSLYSDNCNKTSAEMTVGVHFLPVSTDVAISMPRQNWTMNTLSAKDSAGYYLPVTIDGFDIHHKNFDHIEFQYKLSTQSDDDWVNLCSFYASDSLYDLASGSKAMIENGRIAPFRFYGERDPMEQHYDLRAVSFCRYGTGFVTKTSPVISGVKDTRPPVVFGEPEPANSILGVGDHLKLRFNEAIAGNYLDEDNNFQITGITNETGLTASTALHFDGNASATTKAKRDLTDKSFTIDLMIRPTEANNRANDMILFDTGDEQVNKQLILTKDNRLRLVRTNGKNFLGKSSNPIGDIMAFVRVLCVYEKGGKTRFYAGTEDVTSNNLGSSEDTDEMQERSAFFRFGSTYDGDMLEARVWTKALTLEEISATANHSLTGYERELLAYYSMDEGKGETVTDHANGATLYLDGCSWNKQKGYSLRLDGEPAKLNGNLLGRSSVYDVTLMFWFKAETGGTLFSCSEQQWDVPAGYADGTWHHFVLTVSRAYNNAALFLDGKMVQTYNATDQDGITGAMYLGGNGFKGNIDEFVIFEQALPKSLVELYGDIALTGDEMGLMAYLPFEEQYLNPNGILEQRFCVNDRRVFKDANGDVINKIVPLVVSDVSGLADNSVNAPVKSHGLLNKLYFNWAFNNDELMINLLNRDYEVNKQSVYVTVRDVEDMNGNPMVSPVTWTAFVDRNSLKWSEKQLTVKTDDTEESSSEVILRIINYSGKRHTYTIESLPSWLKVDAEYGAIDPTGEKTVRLTFDQQIAVGEYSDIIYLTDEDGLAEPLIIEYTVEANPPYDDVDKNKYPLNMSVCGQVMIINSDEYVYDTDERDIVYAMYKDQCVGMANISFDEVSNKSKLFLTVYGSDAMNGKAIRFQLWQASTGKTYDLSASRDVIFAHGNVYGCGDGNPVIFTTNGNERQTITLNPGWNWTSFNLDLRQYVAKIANIMTTNEPWSEGDLIKNPATRHFIIYSDSLERFVGDFDYLRYIYTYMIYTENGNTIHISGNNLPTDSMYVTVRGEGQWSAMPCLLSQVTPVAEALADYYDNATPGDLLKSHDRFAYFSEDRKWEGDLTAMRPGEGYFFRRLAPDSVNIRFFNPSANSAPRLANSASGLTAEGGLTTQFTNPHAATNMTMIAKVEGMTAEGGLISNSVEVYVNNDLAAVADPLIIDNEVYYFLTIQSDNVGAPLRFEMDGQLLHVQINEQMVNEQMLNVPDSHHGSLKAPIVLKKDDNRPYKIIEDNHVVIIRNNEKYDVTGKKLE